MESIHKHKIVDFIIWVASLISILGFIVYNFLVTLTEKGQTTNVIIADSITFFLIGIVFLFVESSFVLTLNGKYKMGIWTFIANIIFGLLCGFDVSFFSELQLQYSSSVTFIAVFTIYGLIMGIGIWRKGKNGGTLSEQGASKLNHNEWIKIIIFMFIVIIELYLIIPAVLLDLCTTLGLIASYLILKNKRAGLVFWALFYSFAIISCILFFCFNLFQTGSLFDSQIINYKYFNILWIQQGSILSSFGIIISIAGLLFTLNALFLNPMWKINTAVKTEFSEEKSENKKWRIAVLLFIIVLAIFANWSFLSNRSSNVHSGPSTKLDIGSQESTTKNNLTVKKVMANKKLLLAVIVKYAMVQDNNPRLHHFSLKNQIQLMETKKDNHTTRYDIENNKKIAYITVIKTKDNKDRVVFWSTTNRQITSMTLSSIIKLINQKVSEKELDKTVKKISVQSDEQDGSSSRSSQQSQKATAAQDVTIKDLQEGYLQSDTAMKAILYYAEHNSKADGFWKSASDITTPLYITPNAMGSGFDVGADMGGSGSIVVSSQSMQNGSNEFSIKANGNLPDSSTQYTATQQEIVDFVNAAGGKEAIAGIQYQIKSYDPSNIVSDDDTNDDEDDSDYDEDSSDDEDDVTYDDDEY